MRNVRQHYITLAGIAIGVALGGAPAAARKAPEAAKLQAVSIVGDGIAGGGYDIELCDINDRGDILFTSDVGQGETIWVYRNGSFDPLISTGDPMPRGGVFGGGQVFPAGLNDRGDAAIAFFAAASAPGPIWYANSGVFRYSAGKDALSAVMLPDSTSSLPDPTVVPGIGTFLGVFDRQSINNRGDVSFSGIYHTDKGIHVAGEPYSGMGTGVFIADKSGTITPVAVPGDPAPGGGTFDFARNISINDRGDAAFGAHVAGEEVLTFGWPQALAPHTGESVYVKWAHGGIQSIAHMNDPAPGGGTFRLAFGPRINNRGDLVFIGDLTPAPDAMQSLALFRYDHGLLTRLIGPGDPVPGGGNFVSAARNVGTYDINNEGDIAFSALLDTDVDGDGIQDTGLFLWSEGHLRLVARNGTVVPGVGTVHDLNWTDAPYPSAGLAINDRDEIAFAANLTDGRMALLVASIKD